MYSESDQLAAQTAEGAGSILSSFIASLLRSWWGAAGTDSHDEVNAAQVLKTVEDYNSATRNEYEGPEPECSRDATNIRTGAAAKARGGANIIGDLQPRAWVVVLPCAVPTKLEIQNGTVKHTTAAGSPFVACITDRSNATAMLVLCFIAIMQTFFSNLVFIVFDVCSTIPDTGHNQADTTKADVEAIFAARQQTHYPVDCCKPLDIFRYITAGLS